ncbi:MAG TPA: hypothetical protein VMZ30_10530 [Pyrinomonadaceae bacterium]|nr:hypothetical protein [Pyrinomonadaceae bacterium]
MGLKTSLTTSPLAHFIERLRTAEVVLEPYPHYYLENVFPHDYYRALLNHLPAGSVYQNLFEITDYKLDHFRYRDQRNLNDGWTNSLPVGLKEFWNSFNEWFLGPTLAQAVLESFSAPLRGRFGTEPWPAVSVESQLIRHRAGYFLGPHSDLYTKLVVLLLYLAPDESAAHLGTSLYRPKDPNFSCPNSLHYSFDDFVRATTAPYKPNSLLAFLRSDISFHGVEPISEQDVAATAGRDVIQYVLHDKQAREAQLRAKNLAAKEETA